MEAGGAGLRQVSQMPAEVDCMDPRYLADGRILFGNVAPVQAAPRKEEFEITDPSRHGHPS